MWLILVIIVLVLVLVLVLVWMRQERFEGYHEVSATGSDPRAAIDSYYYWRAYTRNPYDYNRLKHFPYTYQPKPHPGEFQRYYPYFYEYGYGSF